MVLRGSCTRKIERHAHAEWTFQVGLRVSIVEHAANGPSNQQAHRKASHIDQVEHIAKQ